MTLLLPSIKTPHNWEVLELIDWIASLSSTDGFVGTMVDDLPQQALTLLWVLKGSFSLASRLASKSPPSVPARSGT